VRLLPATYVDAARVDDIEGRERAALLYGGEHAMLSYTSALRRWNLPVQTSATAAHVTVPATVRRRPLGGVVVVHNTASTLAARRWGGVAVTRLERAVVDSWTVLDGPHRRAPAIAAVAERKTTPQRLLEEALCRGNVKGRAALVGLCDALLNGCRSELEIWGFRHVFSDARFRHGTWQLPVSLGSRLVYLDLAFEYERVCVELDGAAYHFGHAHRERDMRRDAALSALGWLVLRFSHRRLHEEPSQATAELDAVLRTRRRQLHAA
jgi:very-short-patch-repair endonuclease